ncbi:MAG: twin-arginine translocase TatA/TatE family subunit, partial [Candidatus Nanohaloarchaea archaeon]
MGFIGLNEAILIGAVVLALILGPKKLPELARSIGQSKKEYKRSMKEAEEMAE